MSRQGAVVIFGLLACILGLSQFARGAQAGSVARAARATPTTGMRLAYGAMRRRFALGDGRYAASDTRHSYAHLWPLSQALAASLAVGSHRGPGAGAARADALRTVKALAGYRSGQGYESVPVATRTRSGNLYYDDNTWIGLDLLAAYRQMGGQAILRSAEGVFKFLASGWDTRPGVPCPGGVFWARPPLRQIRTTVSTANAAVVALQLYQATGHAGYLAWGKRMYGWVRACLAGRNGLYYDHLDDRGNVSKREWTYNQGAMVAAGVLLAKTTGDRTYLDQARATAKAALTDYGRAGYKGEPPIFVAIFFGGLDSLRRSAPLAQYRTALNHYLARHVRLRTDGHFGSSLVFQAAAVQLYSFAAGTGR